AVGRLGHFVGDMLRAVPDVRTWGRLVVTQMRRIGVDSLPVALFIAAFTGVVLALQASYTFTGAVPLYFVGTLVGKTMMLELGPVLTGLALAGRVGASMAAELGTMKVTEQVDALETLAYDPQSYLVVPRVVAATLMFPVIVFQDLYKGFDGTPVLQGLSLKVQDRETMVIIGYSGTGKSVALKHIVGLLHPDAGDVIVDGLAVSTLDRDRLMGLRQGIGYVFQFAALFDSMTVAENLELGLRRRGLPDEEIEERVREALALVDLSGT